MLIWLDSIKLSGRGLIIKWTEDETETETETKQSLSQPLDNIKKLRRHLVWGGFSIIILILGRSAIES